MRLFLTSTGLKSNKIKKQFLNLIGDPKKLEVLLMYGAKNEKQLKYAKFAEKELTNLGFENSKIYHINFNKNKIKKPKNFDVIYFCGGNTYYILDRVKKLKLDSLIKKFIDKGGIYLGVSAGSIIIGPDIEIAGWGSEADENQVNLKETKGLNIIKFTIYPHYRFKLRKEINEFSKKVNYPVETLKDNQALLILNNKIKKIK